MNTRHKFFYTIAGLLLAFGLVLGVAAQSASAYSDSDPVRIRFDKSAVAEGVWNGSVSGDVSGDLTTRLQSLRVEGVIWHVVFTWEIDAGPDSFTALLSGTLNTDTGRVVMNGRVVEGKWLGAQVHEEGQLIDPASLRFQGDIRIMPETAP